MYSIYYKRRHNSFQLVSPTSASIMLLILIPFFLVGRISIEEDVSSPNLEYKFKFNMTISTPYDSQQHSYVYDNMKANLLCRPKKSDILTCVLVNEVSKLMVTTLENASGTFLDTTETWIPSDTPSSSRFEIHFDKNGAKSLVVSRNTSSELNLLRTIANQLSVGVNLEHRMSGDFSAMESSTVGKCEVFYKINKKEKLLNGEQTNFTLISVANNYKPRGTVVEIEKHRNLTNCQKKGNYLFITPKNRPVHMGELEPDMTSYSSKFYISDTAFCSESRANTEIMVGDKTVRSEKTRVFLTLEAIQEVDSDIPEIEDPETIGMISEDFAKELHNNLGMIFAGAENEETVNHSKRQPIMNK